VKDGDCASGTHTKCLANKPAPIPGIVDLSICKDKPITESMSTAPWQVKEKATGKMVTKSCTDWGGDVNKNGIADCSGAGFGKQKSGTEYEPSAEDTLMMALYDVTQKQMQEVRFHCQDSCNPLTNTYKNVPITCDTKTGQCSGV
jgi:hypothetical protein